MQNQDRFCTITIMQTVYVHLAFFIFLSENIQKNIEPDFAIFPVLIKVEEF